MPSSSLLSEPFQSPSPTKRWPAAHLVPPRHSSFLRWQSVSRRFPFPCPVCALPYLVHSSLPTQHIILSIPRIQSPGPSRSSQASIRPFSTKRPLRRCHTEPEPASSERARSLLHQTSPHLTSPPRRYPLSPTPAPTLHHNTDLRIDRSSRCRHSARRSPAGLWSDVHSLPHCVCICIHPSIHPSAPSFCEATTTRSISIALRHLRDRTHELLSAIATAVHQTTSASIYHSSNSRCSRRKETPRN